MDKDFKISGREDVLGKKRNIYVKNNKKAKTKYIKCKGEFIRLSNYIKEKAKPAKPANDTGKIIKINKKVNVINNISKIKDIKIRNLLVKTFKKNAKLYFIKDKKGWKAKGLTNGTDWKGKGGTGLTGLTGLTGGIFTGDITRDVLRNRAHETDNTTLIRTLENSNGIIIRKICNLEYQFKIDGVDYIIRPYVILKGNKIIIELYLTNDKDRFWISLPIHISQFFNKNASGKHSFIHITAEMKILEKYHILTTQKLRINSVKKTHTYLMADNIVELLDILRTHGKEVFGDWGTREQYKHINLEEYYNIDRHKWNKINSVYSGHNIRSLDIVKCIEKLDEIFLHIFTTIYAGNIRLPTDGSSVLLLGSSTISVSAIDLTSNGNDFITGSNIHGTSGVAGTIGTSGTASALRTASPRRAASLPSPPRRLPSPPRRAIRDRSRSRDRDYRSPPRRAIRDRSRSRDRDYRRTSPPRRAARDRSRSRDRGYGRARGY